MQKGICLFVLLISLVMPAAPKLMAAPVRMTDHSVPSGFIDRIAFGSCAMQFVEQPIWNTILKVQPKLFLFLGDAIYGDWDGKDVFAATENSLISDWNKLAAKPEFQLFRSRIPILATWDNHDYGKSDGGAEFQLKKSSKRIFLDFFDEPSDSVRRTTEGIYDAKIIGSPGRRVQIILLDTRYFKGRFIKDSRSALEKQELKIVGTYLPNNDPNVTLLGEAQWIWLEEQLRKPADLRLIVSSTQIVADEKGMDEWGNFPLERKKLFNLIRKTRANGVLFLSGNIHFAEISKTDEGPYPLYDFTSSGMTHINELYSKIINSRRVVGPYGAINFGVVEIDWEKQPAALITLKAIGIDGEIAFKYQISLDVLRNEV